MEWVVDQPHYDQFGEIDITISGHSDISGELHGSTVSSLSLPSSSTKNIRHIDKHHRCCLLRRVRPTHLQHSSCCCRSRKSKRINDVQTSCIDRRRRNRSIWPDRS
ncbi:hypothetical protein BLNAU_5383 [Blattamonas nauphoetae]|uniref:Uncharacterized protein n=1 Tax=Blattamonas nauphoetae TaxID=2049346 RepID=A0ABQ9WSY4_9EUKA|nr:hypothetical protein BLNAU_22493 [Blattamonas nauphoetae]KAK2959605.1 hypothetical protein BLNAU_5383 [Blattamonas nauphoetae]